MNIPLTKVVRVMALLAASLPVSSVFAAEGEAVLSPAKRQETLDRAKKLLAPREISATTVDPFHSAAFAETVAGLGRASAVTPSSGGEATAGRPPAGPRTDRDLLQAMAASLKPSGFFVLGGQPTLVFGQKRVKAGGFLTITFEGAQYTLEITAIDRTNFTLRLNREEFTRPIK